MSKILKLFKKNSFRGKLLTLILEIAYMNPFCGKTENTFRNKMYF